MKPKINTKSLLFKMAFAEYKKRCEMALEVEQTVESAVIPIYHKSEGKRVGQIGSGVLIKIKNEYFVLSASHVFDQIGNYALLTSDGVSELQMLPGERFSTPRDELGGHTHDPLDASAFHITAPISERLKERAITPADFDPNPTPSTTSVFLSAGFRIKKTNLSKGVLSSKREAFPSNEIKVDDYAKTKLNPEYHIALWHEDQHYTGTQWLKSPTPRGFSGGAIIRIIDMPGRKGIEHKQVLSGIIIEHIKKSKRIEGLLVGTRLAVYMAAIEKFMPEVFKE